MFFVSANDAADEFVADDIGVFKTNKADAFHGGKSLDGFD